MDLKVAYWTAAWINLLVLSFFALSGVQQVRRGQVARHRRSMLTAVWLVVFFVVSYLVKLALLGREDLTVWSAAAIWTLRRMRHQVGSAESGKAHLTAPAPRAAKWRAPLLTCAWRNCARRAT